MTESIFTSVEFYIIAFVVAIAITGFMFHPSKKDEAITYFFKASLFPSQSNIPSLYIEALEDGNLKITHKGIHANEMVSTSIALTIIGSDLRIVEKQTPIASWETPLYDAVYIIDRLKPLRYHLYFDSEITNSYATSSLVNESPFHVEVSFTE